MAESQVNKANRNAIKNTERIPLHEQKSMLETTPRKGWVRRWIRDVGVRVNKLKLAGYQIVKEKGLLIGDSRVNFSLGEGYRVYGGSDKTGAHFNLVLMETTRINYNKDQKAKQEIIDESEKAILDKGKSKGFYEVHQNETIHGIGLNRKMPK